LFYRLNGISVFISKGFQSLFELLVLHPNINYNYLKNLGVTPKAENFVFDRNIGCFGVGLLALSSPKSVGYRRNPLREANQ
jgi:hypothetical protein